MADTSLNENRLGLLIWQTSNIWQSKLRKILKNYTSEDYLLLTGDPAIIGVACSIVSDITNGRYKLLKWDKQEKRYYPIEINLYEKGKKDE